MSQTTGRRKRWRRPLFVGLSAAIAVSVVLASRAVMMPFVLAALIAYVLTPLVARAERRGGGYRAPACSGQVALRLTALTGASRLDDVFFDPRVR